MLYVEVTGVLPVHIVLKAP